MTPYPRNRAESLRDSILNRLEWLEKVATDNLQRIACHNAGCDVRELAAIALGEPCPRCQRPLAECDCTSPS